MSILMIGVGVGAWALGRTQQNKPSTPPPRTEHSSGYGGPGGSSGPFPGSSHGGPRGPGPTPSPGPDPGAGHGPPPPPPPHSDPPPFSGPPPHSTSNSGPPPQSPPNPGPPPHSTSSADPPPHSTPKSAPPPQPASDSAPPPRPQKPTPGPSPEKPKPTWQRQQSGSTPKAEAPKGSWEKAREETRRREDERKARQEEQRRKDEAARKLREQREREAKEREQREREARDRREKLEAERRERLDAEKRERELRERLERERLEREKLQREKDERDRVDRLEREKFQKLEQERVERLEREKFLREAREREARERAAREKDLEEMRKREEEEAKAAKKASTSYAYSGVGEKVNPWPNGKPKVPPAPAPSSYSTPPRPAPSTTTFDSPNDDQRPPAPSVNTYTATEDDAYSYRPYDKPKQARGRKNSMSTFSETSWTASHTTSRTSPPPSMRAPYTTKDPDKIVIKAVYLFLNQFSKTPVSQLVSGVGSVTDGLILRATTEGLFIDDDVRGVPQREWDVKAWTLKQVEVWCPPHCLTPSPHTPGSSASKSNVSSSSAKVRDRGVPKILAGDDADTYLTEMLRACKDCCRLGLCEATFRNTNVPSPTGQTGEWRDKGLHLLRATIRDQQGKRYLFVIGEEESWKVAVGLQRLRRGTQARALGVGALSSADARGSLEMLGWV